MRRGFFFALEIISVTALVLQTRCANYADVFVGHQIYFVDADCYARMTRARICFEHPGTIVRWHDFENFPVGISPHTTAPLDYLIVAIAKLLSSFASNPLDLAGAIISPLLSIALGIFLCWWSRRMALRFRFALLLLFAASPVLAHGFALGRPDHQALLIALITVAICAEWRAAIQFARSWSILASAAWGFALWVSIYEPLVLLALLLVLRGRLLFRAERRAGWLVFAAILLLAALIERRVPALPAPALASTLHHWSASIGELSHVSLGSNLWFQWCGWLLLAAPILFLRRKADLPIFLPALLVATFVLSIWQARWGYFLAVMYALLAPEILSRFGKRWVAVTVFVISLFPIAQAWDGSFGPAETLGRSENLIELAELRRVAVVVDGPFLAPWWLSPALAYWSRQPAVAGSSHESIAGIADNAHFYATNEFQKAIEICQRRKVRSVVEYDGERFGEKLPRSPNDSYSAGRPLLRA